MSEDVVFSGKEGLAVLTAKKVGGVDGALLKISNSKSKVNTVPSEAFAEINQALDHVENEKKFKFLVLYGGEGKIHAGADVNMFFGGLHENENPPNYSAVKKYLHEGTAIDLRIKKIGKEKRTVGIMYGERYGGSVEWPLFAEFVVTAPDTGIQFSEVNIGLIPGWNGILNVILKAGFHNALFMGVTGKRITAQQMLETGIADRISEFDRLMDTALEIAASSSISKKTGVGKRLASENELFAILSMRMDTRKYEALANEVSKMKEKPGADPKELSKFIDKKLEELGKPLAPLSVESVFGYVAKYGTRIDSNDLELLSEAAFDEADRCNALMKTFDRVIGINSVLKARENPLNKIPIFGRK